ncbi:hypothetical protein Gogos_003074 [Gossypium gossypioides]|uniref:DUF4283 domain-containing protein n=1 Tax=Gossypium gossypioides TaxID=34282 RepID=A0A7J9CLF3_GOSGO|nr:hypothetical protein [Gossypium gossypioides]
MEDELAQLSINKEEEDTIHIPIDPSSEKGGEFFQLVGCFLTASMIHFSAMKSIMANLWHPIRGVRIRDLGGKKVLVSIFSRHGYGQGFKEFPLDL